MSAGSLNLMNSLKEKIAEKLASGGVGGAAKKTPSRLHAMLNDQLGCEQEEPERKSYLQEAI